MTDTPSERKEPPITLDRLIADAAEQGLPPPTVETLIRTLAYPRTSLSRPRSSKDPLMNFGSSTVCGNGPRILGVAHLSSLGAILSSVGLDHMLADLAVPSESRLDTMDSSTRFAISLRLASLQEEQCPYRWEKKTLEEAMWDWSGIWQQLKYPHDTRKCAWLRLYESGGASRLGWHLEGESLEPRILATLTGRDCGQAIRQLEELASHLSEDVAHSAVRFEELPNLQAGDVGCLSSAFADQPHNVYILFGEKDFMPLFLLPLDSSPPLEHLAQSCASRGDSPMSFKLSHIGLSESQSAEALLALFPAEPDIAPASPEAAVLLFGQRTPYNASLASRGESLPHLLFSSFDPKTRAEAEQRIRSRFCDDLRQVCVTKQSTASCDLPRSSAIPSSALRDGYRLATFADLLKDEPVSAAFVARDGRLGTIHALSPFRRASAAPDAASSLPARPATSIPSCTSDTVPATSERSLLLVSSERLGSGNQGVVHRAYCADSPFPLVVKYSCEPEYRWDDSMELVCDEIAFYQAHGADLAAEKIAPGFVGGWTAEGEGSPRMFGTRTAVLVLEEWGEPLKQSEEHEFEAEDLGQEGRLAVFRLVRRLHTKLGLEHCSLYPRNFLWKTELGYSSLRLVDWARREAHVGPCKLSDKWEDDDSEEEDAQEEDERGSEGHEGEETDGEDAFELCRELKKLRWDLGFDGERK